ncbi:MAG: hypothetical protein LBE60_09880 [Microbacterium sp.]|jgi:hypothetical protein|uniref:hypothetical protein n=1 Tax=Microbacterium sp. TaxID=51671 RepID=UPI002834400B|nr:hypothetical protein [Microbacterium sp.]MDR2321942.1 hypothetical protein [Microbacterium sp.]
MNETTLTAAERIRAFADAVRAQLADLPADEVDDLVEGLVGDLTDQAADHDGAIELGDPAAYAEELRSAAGLPERGPLAAETKTPWHERIAAAAGRAVARIRSSRAGAEILGVLGALRPLWWLARGFGMFAVLSVLLGYGIWTMLTQGWPGMRILAWTLLMLLIVISVQWGRGRWLPKNRLRHIRTVASIIAVLILPFAAGAFVTAVTNHGNSVGTTTYEQQPLGLSLDGDRVVNLFVYDKDGKPIEGAQVYTNRGTPLNLMGRDSEQYDSAATYWGFGDSGTTTLPYRDAQGRPVWNVYPLQLGRLDDSTGQIDPSTTLTPQPPFLRAPDRALTATPAPSPGSTMPPTPTPSPRPSEAVPSPSPTPTPAG